MRFTHPLALLLFLAVPLVVGMAGLPRGPGRGRARISLGLRLVIVACLVLSLAGLEGLRINRQLAVVFVLDESDSIPAALQDRARQAIRQAVERLPAGDLAAVVVFGSQALVERSMNASHELDNFLSKPVTQASDLGAAIRLGLALYPPGAARRMVILSDGDANQPDSRLAARADAQAAARLAAANGVQIVSVPLSAEIGPEVLLNSVQLPEQLHQGERFDLHLTLEANHATQASIRVLADGGLVYQGSLQLNPGSQSYSLPLTAGQPGFSRYVVQVEPAQDSYYQNNTLAAFAQVQGPPRLLVIVPPAGEPLPYDRQARPDEAGALVQALNSSQFKVDRAGPEGLPVDLATLASYAAVLLVDVPARDLSQRQMTVLQSYVRDLGGGLVAIGGPTSYGVGGYFRTPLEQTLPVEMQIKDPQRRPTLSMVFIIDRSGSMSETSGGVSKLELAKEAAMRSVELLFPGDRVGVIAFDDQASWVVPLTDLQDSRTVVQAIGGLRSGGGTDILAGLQLMAQSLPDDPSTVKHVILLTDGGADPTGIPELVKRLNRQEGITLTTVGVGPDAAPYLPDLAELGGGRYHYAADPASIPSIFTEETSLASRSYLVEEPFVPRIVDPSPILSGLNQLPTLQGYVATSAKSLARTILASGQGDPILASWRYGLGQAVAFTSDASGRWARDWLTWQGYTQFWAQSVGSVLGQMAASPLSVRVIDQPGAGQASHRLVVEAQSEDGRYLDGYSLQANLSAPDGSLETLHLEQTAPGRYEAGFTPSTTGAYLLHVAGEPPAGSESEGPLSQTSGWVLSYSPEYRQLQPDPQLLANLARLSGGDPRPITLAELPEASFQHNLPGARTAQPAWPLLLLTAALLLPLDVATRRLVLSPTEIRAEVGRLAGRLRPPSTWQPQADPAQRARLAALQHAKQAALSPEQSEDQPIPAWRQTQPSNSPSQESDQPAGEGGIKEHKQPATQNNAHHERPSEAGVPTAASEQGADSTAASLLAAKRARHKKG